MLPRTLCFSGHIKYKGIDIISLTQKQLSKLRGREIGLIPQEGEQSLNPVLRIDRQVLSYFRFQEFLPRPAQSMKTVPFPFPEPPGSLTPLSSKKPWSLLRPFKERLNREKLEAIDSPFLLAYQRLRESLCRLGITDPDRVLKSYPHELSGGMNRRVVVASVLLLNPKLLLIDEPTVGLDEENKARFLQELFQFVAQEELGILLITHDLYLVSNLKGKVLVLYGGMLVEETEVTAFFTSPLHPYTKALLEALPERGFLSIPGLPYSPLSPLPGCPFYPRCPHRMEICAQKVPQARVIQDSPTLQRRVWCHRYG